jgi:hypothetical protein
MKKMIDSKTAVIIVLSLALVLTLVYIGLNELSKQEYQFYLSGVRDGNAQALNTIIQELQSKGYAEIGILNGNTTATLRLVPLPANSTR